MFSESRSAWLRLLSLDGSRSEVHCGCGELRFEPFEFEVQYNEPIDLLFLLRLGFEDGDVALQTSVIGERLAAGFLGGEIGGNSESPGDLRGLKGFEAGNPTL